MKKSSFAFLLVLAAAGAWTAYHYRAELLTFAGLSAEQPATTAGRGPGGGFGPGGGQGRPVLVVSAPVELEEISDRVRAIGTVAAIRSVDLFPQVSAPITEIDFRPGHPVTAGQQLVGLEREEQAIAVERAKIALTDAENALKRAEQLAQSRTVSEVALANAQSELKNAEIALKGAELALNRRIMTAPFAGTVGLSDIAIGDLVTTSTRIVTLDDLSALTVTFSVPEKYAGRMAIDLPISAVTEALPGQLIEGRLIEIDSRIDETTRSLAVKGELNEGSEKLKPGMAVNVTAAFDPVARLSVPSAALQWDREGAFVWKIVEGKAKRTGVDVFGRRSGSVLVSGELQEGDEVAVEGIQSLREGASVIGAGIGAPAGRAPGGPSRRPAPEG